MSAYVKYNGFLGILGFDDNGFLFCSKSTVGGGFADKFNFKAKELYRKFNDWDELHAFLEWFSTDMNASRDKEGYVITDGKYQFKLKGAGYKFWKWMRTIKDRIANGRDVNVSGMNAEATLFCGWAQRKGREYCATRDIISLRNEYEKETEQ